MQRFIIPFLFWSPHIKLILQIVLLPLLIPRQPKNLLSQYFQQLYLPLQELYLLILVLLINVLVLWQLFELRNQCRVLLSKLH